MGFSHREMRAYRTTNNALEAIAARQLEADMASFGLRNAITDFMALDEASRVEQFHVVSGEVRALVAWIKDCAGRIPE